MATTEVSIFDPAQWNSLYVMVSGMILTAISGYLYLRINLYRKRKEEEAVINTVKSLIDEIVEEVYVNKTVPMKAEMPDGKLTPEQIETIRQTCIDLVKVRINKTEEEQLLNYISDVDKFLMLEVPMAYDRLKARKDAENRLAQVGK